MTESQYQALSAFIHAEIEKYKKEIISAAMLTASADQDTIH